MNLLNLCLKIPNLGILLYYLIFVVIIPYVLIANSSLEILKFYMPMMVALAHLLTRAGHKKVFGNLYDLKPKNYISFISSNFINLFALFGILWQCVEHSKNTNDVSSSVIYGIVLFIIAIPFSRVGLKFVLDNADLYLKEKTDIKYKYNWHLVVFGLLYIIFILGLQAILLSMLTSYKQDVLRNNLNEFNIAPVNNRVNNRVNKRVNNRVNNRINNRVNNKQIEDMIEEITNNRKNNINTLNKNTKNVLNSFSLSNISNLKKK